MRRETKPDKFKLSMHELKQIQPMTPNQGKAFAGFESHEHVLLNGSAGTGKSLLSLYHGLVALANKEQDKLIIVRSTVPCRDIGFLPGTADEKIAVYEAPYDSLTHFLTGKKTAYEHMKKAGIIEFLSTSFLRGLTWDDCIVFVDEMQNMTYQEINTIITRIGDNTRLFISADSNQTDLKNSGYPEAFEILSSMDDFSVTTFVHDDIVRSKLVKDWIIANECKQAKK